MRTDFSVLRALALGGVGLVGAACGAAPPKTAGSTPLTAARLYPMRPGSVWTYDVDTGEGVPVLAITRVTSCEQNRCEVSSGSDPIVYERRDDGLYRPDLSAYVLKEPLRMGARWDAGAGSEAEVTGADLQLSTEAGSFSGCLEVVVTGADDGKRVRTVFCPDVGPVELESSITLTLSTRGARVLGRLRGYDFSGALVSGVAEP